VVLYWLATGEQPFPGESLTAVSYKVVHTEPVPPSKMNPSVPPALEAVILKCLAKAPAARYQTGEELARELGALRGGTNSGSLQRTAMRVPLPGETDATMDSHPGAAPHSAAVSTAVATVALPAQQTATPAVAAKAPNRSALVALVVFVAVALIAGGWYFVRGRHPAAIEPSVASTSPTLPTSSVAPTVTQSAMPVPMSAAPSTPPKPAAVAAPKPPSATAAKPNPAKASSNAAATHPADPVATAVDFDPKSLDTNANAKLKIDPPRVPDTVQFTVEMNGKKYYEWSGAGNKSEYQNLFVPPGVQEFRVTGRSDGAEVASNIVSTEFKAKKRKTLKIELRNKKPAKGEAVPPLSSDSQLFVTLK
jgi:serine/threonine-protein kinase